MPVFPAGIDAAVEMKLLSHLIGHCQAHFETDPKLILRHLGKFQQYVIEIVQLKKEFKLYKIFAEAFN